MTKEIKTIVTTSHCDMRSLAAIAKFYAEDVGQHPVTRSNLVRLIIEDFHNILISNNKIKQVQTHEEAANILIKIGLISVAGQDRAARAFVKQIKLEDIVAKEFEESPLDPVALVLDKLQKDDSTLEDK